MRNRVITGLAALALAAGLAASTAAASPPAHPAAPAAASRFIATTHVRGCHWAGRGEYRRGYIELRITKDTCSDRRIRIRVWEQCVVSGFHAGNWVDDPRQLSSTDCHPDVAENFGIDWQIDWPHGKVHSKSYD